MDSKFWLPEYPYTEYYEPPVHEWIDAGVRKTWCKKCHVEGYWDQGKVVPSSPSTNSIYCSRHTQDEAIWGHTD